MTVKCSLFSKIRSALKEKEPKKDSYENACGVSSCSGSINGTFKVKVEVHSSSSGAGSNTNLSSPEISSSDGGKTTENEYEDIYVVKENTIAESKTNGAARRGSRDSGSHSRSESISSTNSNVVIHVASALCEKLADNQDDFESGVSSASPSDLGHSEEEQEVSKIRGHHTLPHQHPNSRLLKRVVSEPGAIYSPPPPPPPLPGQNILHSSVAIPSDTKYPRQIEPSGRASSVTVENISSNRGSSTVLLKSNDDANSNSEIAAQSTQSEKYSSSPASERSAVVVTSCSAEPPSASQQQQQQHAAAPESNAGGNGGGPHLVNKQLVLPFIPPKFSNTDNDSNSLIKPSEYLRSIAACKTNAKLHKTKSELNISTLDEKHVVSTAAKDTPLTKSQENGPPPPPLMPDAERSTSTLKHQPLSFISTNDLTSVQLRKIEKTPATKTMSVPYGALPVVQSQPFQSQKQDLIAELKLSKDISGIKKLKVERVKMEEKQEKEMVIEISRQFSIDNFVEKIPDTDSTGNPIPPWKRQMLAKKAAEKAKKELEEQVAKEAESRRLQSIPAWKRQLMQAKKTDEKCYVNHSKEAVANNTEMTVNLSVAGPRSITNDKLTCDEENNKENNVPDRKENGEPETVVKENDEAEQTHIIPWRAQLRKTNSKLNLLE